MTLASTFFILFACNIIRVISTGHVYQNRTEVNNQRDISFDFNCNDALGSKETCSVTLNMEKTLQEVIDQFSNLIKDRNATLVRIWLKFPEHEGFNPMLVNTSDAYGLWLWHWLYDDRGKSLLLLPHSAEFYSFGTLFLRGPEFYILFRDNNGSSREIAHLPECCKLGIAARLIFKITNSSINNGRKESNHLCHRYIEEPDTDAAEVKFRCCQMANFWDDQGDCYKQTEGNKWIKGIAISIVILIVVVWVFVLPVACWHIMPAAITEQPIVWKEFCKGDDTCRKESDPKCEKVIYRKESDLLPYCTSYPVTIATISKYWRYLSEDSSRSQKRKCTCKLLKRCIALGRFVFVVPVCVILLVSVGPIFLRFTDVEVEVWTMSTGFPAPRYELGPFMPYPFMASHIVTVCTLYATYSLACAVFILMFGDTVGILICVNHKQLSCILPMQGTKSKMTLFYSVRESYQHFLDAVQNNQDNKDQHFLVNVLLLIRKAQIEFLKGFSHKQTSKTKSALIILTCLPPITFFVLIYEITKYCYVVLGNSMPKRIIFTLSFFTSVTLLAYFILLISLWVILYSFSCTLMGIALNPDKLAPFIVVVLTIVGYVLTIYYAFVKSYENLTKQTFEMLLSEHFEDRCVEYVADTSFPSACKTKGSYVHVQETEDDKTDLTPLVFRNVVFAQSATREDCILQDTLCFVLNKIQPVRHELGVAMIKLSSLVVFIIFAFFVIQSFGVHPALATALTAIVGAVPAVFKARRAASSQTNATNDLLRSKIKCALKKYCKLTHFPSQSQSAESIQMKELE